MYDYLIMAFLAGNMLAIICALISPFLVLSRQALIADGLSHASFLGFVIGAVTVKDNIYIPLLLTIMLVIVFRLLVDFAHIKADSTIGIIATIGLSLGMILLSLWQKHLTLDLHSLMQGSILDTTKDDVFLFGTITLLVIELVAISYHPLFKITFNVAYAKLTKTNVKLYQYLLSIIIAIIVVMGVRMIGVLLISTLIIFPCLIAQRFKKSFLLTIIISVVSASIAFNTGMILSVIPVGNLNTLPPSGVIALSFVLLLLLTTIITYTLRKAKQRKHTS